MPEGLTTEARSEEKVTQSGTRYGGFGPQAKRVVATRTLVRPVTTVAARDQPLRARAPRGHLRVAFVALAVVGFLLLVAVNLYVPTHLWLLKAERAGDRAYWSRVHHVGPVASLAELRGEGRVYLLPLGVAQQPYGAEQVAEWLRAKYPLEVRVLPALQPDDSAWDSERKQYVAELLGEQIDRAHPELAAEPNAVVIGITDANIYLARGSGDLSYSARLNEHLAVVSTYDYAEHGLLERWAYRGQRAQELPAKLRRFVLKNVAILHWHLRMNHDPSSLLRDPLDPDVQSDDIWASDLDPEGTKWGEAMASPCLYFEWTAKTGMEAMNGPVLRPCKEKWLLGNDESAEMVQVDLLTQTVRDARTDLYLPDSVPISFQRVLRPGGTLPTEFGVSGSHSYDKYLWATSMRMLHRVGPEFFNEDLRRVPWWLPAEPINKWVDADFSGRLMTLTHHSLPHEHYELRDLHGNVEDYLPCEGSIPCYLNGYRDVEGRALRFERSGTDRRLDRLTSPSGRWLGLEYDGRERLTQIHDSDGRAVHYGYNGQNQLTRVLHADGSVMSYTYDDQQRLLTISAAPDAASAPQEVLRNTYGGSGNLVRQTLANGDSYRYVQHPMSGAGRKWVTVATPDGQSTEVVSEGWRAGLWRTGWNGGQSAK